MNMKRALFAGLALALVAGSAWADTPPTNKYGQPYIPLMGADGISPASASNAVPISGTTNADALSTGNTLNSATPNAAYTVTLKNGEGVTAFSVAGLTASTATLTIEASDDGGTSWTAINGVAPNTGALFTTLTTDQQFRVNSGGRTRVRLRVSSTGTGTITVASNAASVSSLVGLSSQLPAGANILGGVTVAAANTGGDTTYTYPGGTGNALITNTAVLVVAGAHSLMQGGDIHNKGAADCYLQIFDAATAGAVTLGTTVPLRHFWSPANGAWTIETSVEGIKFANGIVIAATTTETGSTACAAGQAVNMEVK